MSAAGSRRDRPAARAAGRGRRLAVGGAAALTLWLAGCATTPDAPQEPPPAVQSYYPLAVGNSWLYRRQYLGQVGTMEVRIVGRGDGFYKDSQGAELAMDALGLRDRKRYLLRAPLARGATWTSVTALSSVERYEVAEVGFTDVVEAGKFEQCVRVRATNRLDAKTELVNEMTYAPNVGLIRIHTIARIEGKGEIPQQTTELVKFQPGT